jgi:integrase
MPVMIFTKYAVDRLPLPSTGQVQYFERLKKGRSLVLNLSYGGTRNWRVLYYQNGKPKSHSLGSYPELSVGSARLAAYAFKSEQAIAAAKAGTFGQIADDWLREHVDELKLRSAKELRRQLKVYILPKWADKRIYDIRRSDVIALGREIKRAHGQSMATAVFTTITNILTWYSGEGDDYISPINRAVRKKIDPRKAKERARDRFLDDDEIRALFKACDDIDPIYGSLIKCLLFTGQRLRTVAKMRHDDLEDGVWTIPKEARAKGHAGALRLPSVVMEIIDAQPRLAGNPHVFPSPIGKGPINSFGHRKDELDRKLRAQLPHMEGWVQHDLRRTWRSLMARAGVSSEIAERTYGHKVDGVEGIYNRYDYAKEKAEALNKLAALIATILNPTPENNVVQLRK